MHEMIEVNSKGKWADEAETLAHMKRQYDLNKSVRLVWKTVEGKWIDEAVLVRLMDQSPAPVKLMNPKATGMYVLPHYDYQPAAHAERVGYEDAMDGGDAHKDEFAADASAYQHGQQHGYESAPDYDNAASLRDDRPDYETEF